MQFFYFFLFWHRSNSKPLTLWACIFTYIMNTCTTHCATALTAQNFYQKHLHCTWQKALEKHKCSCTAHLHQRGSVWLELAQPRHYRRTCFYSSLCPTVTLDMCFSNTWHKRKGKSNFTLFNDSWSRLVSQSLRLALPLSCEHRYNLFEPFFFVSPLNLSCFSVISSTDRKCT